MKHACIHGLRYGKLIQCHLSTAELSAGTDPPPVQLSSLLVPRQRVGPAEGMEGSRRAGAQKECAMTHRTVQTKGEEPSRRLLREKSALKSMFGEPGLYEVR